MQRLKVLNVLILLVMIFILSAGTGLAAAQGARTSSAGRGPAVVQGKFGFMPSLLAKSPRPPAHVTAKPDRNVPFHQIPRPSNSGGSISAGDQSVVQESSGAPLPAPTTFEGINNLNNTAWFGFSVNPPDPNGAIGPAHYLEIVNSLLTIYDRNTGVPSYGPVPISSLFSFALSPCYNDDGDPLVLYDALAGRWVVSEFGLDFVTPEFHQCFAVSQTANPLGGWYSYDFLISTTKMNDYPKIGVWSDGYYMSINQFIEPGDAWGGAGAVVFDRSKMLAGAPATAQYFDIGAVNIGFGGMLPSDLDGPAPAAGTPNYFAEWDDSTWLGDASDTLRVWNFHVDWVTPANSTFGADALFTPNNTIATANVNPYPCDWNGAEQCISQKGTTQKVDALSDRLMNRLQYRKFGGYATLVSNHTVAAGGSGHAAPHWFILRNPGSGWGMQQQGVYAPDGKDRWMGSIAMNGAGSLALGYSVSSSTKYPSIAFTGRLAADPTGAMMGEGTMWAGTGYQGTPTSTDDGYRARWGDYTRMAVDPNDDKSFWYVNEYYPVSYPDTGYSGLWHTRIGHIFLPEAFMSAGVQDGWVLESGENTNVGGSLNATAAAFRLGDDAARRQYRGILSFNTSALPDTAVITKATLKLRRQSITGPGNPFSIFQGLMIDMRKGFFATLPALQISDFQALASSGITGFGPFSPVPSGTLYTITLPPAAYPYVNKLTTNGGLTQLRLRFKLDDNNNAIANFISFFSGNAGAALRPALVIEYNVP